MEHIRACIISRLKVRVNLPQFCVSTSKLPCGKLSGSIRRQSKTPQRCFLWMVLIASHMLLNKGAFEYPHLYQQSSRRRCVNVISSGPNASTKTLITWLLLTVQQIFNRSTHLTYQSYTERESSRVNSDTSDKYRATSCLS